MANRKWTDKEWKNVEINLERYSKDKMEYSFNFLLELTNTQEEHPEWYESACLCQLCCSYGD